MGTRLVFIIWLVIIFWGCACAHLEENPLQDEPLHSFDRLDEPEEPESPTSTTAGNPQLKNFTLDPDRLEILPDGESHLVVRALSGFVVAGEGAQDLRFEAVLRVGKDTVAVIPQLNEGSVLFEATVTAEHGDLLEVEVKSDEGLAQRAVFELNFPLNPGRVCGQACGPGMICVDGFCVPTLQQETISSAIQSEVIKRPLSGPRDDLFKPKGILPQYYKFGD